MHERVVGGVADRRRVEHVIAIICLIDPLAERSRAIGRGRLAVRAHAAGRVFPESRRGRRARRGVSIVGATRRLFDVCRGAVPRAGGPSRRRNHAAMANGWTRAQPYLIAALFVSAGINHFVNDRVYEAIMPDYLPMHHEAVVVSGIAEIAGGLGALVPQTRVAAGWGLIALLVAVFPANLDMAVHADKFPKIPAWGLWARLPLQFLAIAWVHGALVRPKAP